MNTVHLCSFCSKEFNHESGLEGHTCESAKEDMTRPSSTEVHERSAFIYPLNVCKKSKDGVENSMIDVKDKAYESPECGKVSVTKQSLKYHQITLSHLSALWPAIFAVSWNIHTSHEAESDFERKKCIKTFSSKNDLDNY
ncbi:unnamed protein product [Timema podura]|uniref:C2H2-type domain-containing protein n=1 Tax=Timema podura TaxID=61482 RepID=A0ABN7NG36_TIMPD|nr:unnamed protein product [Timema podura]